MKAAFIFYTTLLVLEGLLAWLLTGQAFLLTAAATGLALYATLRFSSRPLAEATRFFTALILAVGGPLQYQTGLAPLLLCFIALPHFLAATQALAELSGTVPSRESPGMRSMVFNVAFYTSMGLILLLAGGIEPALSRTLTNCLAVLVLFLALPAWELSRIPRLRPALPASSPFSARRFLLPAALLGIAAFAFTGPLPLAADFLCQLSPRWRINSVEFKNKPPKPPPTGQGAKPAPAGGATRLGMDESSVTGEHTLPSRSNLQSTEAPRFFLQPDPPALTANLLAQGPVYLRSHTLNRFQDNKWTPEISGGRWIEDAADGRADGIITFPDNPPVRSIPHEVFAFGADGYTVPTLPGLKAIHLPRVFAVPGDVLQSSATGDIRYKAVSSPVLYQALPNRTLLETAVPDDPIHLVPAAGELEVRMQNLAGPVFAGATLLADRIDALHAFFARNYSYSTVMQNPNQLGALENFLFDERRGHCDFYATTAALLLRQRGVPTRIAYGFATRDADPTSGLLTVRDRHAHAWTEIFLKGYGWTICDFTPSASIGQPADPPNRPPPVPEPKLDTFADAARETKLPTPEKAREIAPIFSSILTWFQQQTWLPSLMKHGPWVLVALALIVLAGRLLKRRPADAAAIAAAQARADYEKQPAYFQEFLRVSAAAGHPKPESSTPLEHYRILRHAGLPVPPLRPLIDYHCDTRYADAPRDETRELGFGQDLQTFAAAVLTPFGPPRPN